MMLMKIANFGIGWIRTKKLQSKTSKTGKTKKEKEENLCLGINWSCVNYRGTWDTIW